jgi:hypothetical protein
MLFLLAMEPLHRLFRKAQEQGLLKQLSSGCDAFRASLYADDVVVFINPIVDDLQVTTKILSIFSYASGLRTNMEKTQFYPIRCELTNLYFISQNNMVTTAFPCTHLGLPLHIKKLPKNVMMELVHKVANRLLGRKRNMLTYPRRELLVKTVLLAVPTFFSLHSNCPSGVLQR